MQNFDLIQELEKRIAEKPDIVLLKDLFGLICIEKSKEYYPYNRLIREKSYDLAMEGSIDSYELYKKTLLYEAIDDLDSYLLYIEFDRNPEKRFYLPRRDVLKPIVDDLQALENGELDFLSISLPPRSGKLISDNTPVLTSGGWKNHGDLRVGDMVISLSGKFVKVTHVFEKNVANIRVHFTDGTYIDCHENHEWLVYNRNSHKTQIMETKSMMSNYDEGEPGRRGHRYVYQLPHRGFAQGEHKKLPVEPYTLGAWLGDGRNNNPDICGAEDDYPIIESIIADGYNVSWQTTHKTTGVKYYGFKSLRAKLQSVGMCHSRRRTPKHIPEEYLTASIDQRLELLAGLLDTDGTLTRKEKRYKFTTADESLRDNFITLVSTFGWRCSIQEHLPRLSSSGIQGRKTYWSIAFNPTHFIPCRLERKQLREFSKQRKIAICRFDNIHPINGNCISVDGGLYCVGERLIPTHNSTLGCFFITWLMGKYPDLANVMSGHSDKLTKGFYQEVLSIITDPQYLWKDVFPLQYVGATSANDESIDIGTKHSRRFSTLTCRSIGGTLTGAVEVGKCLYCDDLIEDLEESLNPQRLQNKYDAYANQLKDRMKEKAYQVMIGTRWAVMDVQGRIREQYEDNPRYKFRVLPALDENGESNFDYPYGLGFSTEYYMDMKASIDDATWCAKYMGKPYVREGLLFPADELNYYNGVLPDGDPYKVAVCDVAWGGGDSLSMPFAYQFGSDVYIHDVIFNKGDKTVTQPVVVGRTKQHMPHKERYEANNGGGEYCDAIDQALRKDGVRINLTAKRAPSNQSKIGRIIQFSPDIKRFYFIDEKNRTKEYQAFMTELCLYSQVGKNPHDDAPDSLAMLADELYNGATARVEFGKRPW